MPPKSFASLPMDQLDAAGFKPAADWLWHGYLAPGNLTLLTSLWKAGKTTLLTGLHQRLATGGTFLDRRCAAGKALVVSGAPPELEADRLRVAHDAPLALLLTR